MNEYMRSKLLGCTYGNAVGDALGAPAEFKSRGTCYLTWPDGLREMLPAGQTRSKNGGEYTDDTEMMVAIGLGIIAAGKFNPAAVAKEFHEWYRGHPPDVGCQTSSILSKISESYGYAVDIAMSECGDYRSGNGSVMRQAICVAYAAEASYLEAMHLAELQSALTHASRQCFDSCKLLMMVCKLLLDEQWHLNEKDFDPLKFGRKAVTTAFRYAEIHNFHPKVLGMLEKLESIESEEDIPTSGYVIDTMVRALYPLYTCQSFEDGLVQCIMQGGDADSAGAVCGSLLGLRDGFDAIPSDWVEAVQARENAHRAITIEDMTQQVYELGKAAYAPIV